MDEKQFPGKTPKGCPPTMHGPAIYEIRVRGHLDDRWSDKLGGLQTTTPLEPWINKTWRQSEIELVK